MSQENVGIVRRSFEAFQIDGLEGLLRYVHPGIEWTTTGAFVEAATYRGHEGVRRYLGSMLDEFDDAHIEPEELIDAGDQVVVLARISGRGKQSGAAVELKLMSVGSLRAGKLFRIRNHATKADALEAVREHPSPPENIESKWLTTELQEFDRRGTAMFTLPGVPGLDIGLWMLTQGGKPIGLIRRVEAGYSVRTACERWDAAIRRRGRVGWQLEFARTGAAQTAIYYLPRGLLDGGHLDVPTSGTRYRLRTPVVRETWRLTGTTRGESVQIAFRSGGPVPAFKRHVQLDADLANEPLLPGVILASSVALLVHFEQPRVGTAG